MSDIHFYFAYGSNMNRTRVEKRAMPFVDHHPGRLQNFRLAFNKRSTIHPGAASANVIESPGDVVEGVLYRLPDHAGIEMMDPFEGYPVRYSRSRLPVLAGETVCHAWVYLANDEYIADGLKPARWYLNHLLAGKPHLSEPYFERLAITECLPDSDTEPR